MSEPAPARHADARVARLVGLYETLVPADLPGLRGVYADDARFKDPFNQVQGVAAIARIFSHMFGKLDSPRFQVIGIVADGDDVVLTWDFTFRTRGAGAAALCIHGASHVRFNTRGQVAMHRDYWDAAEELYEKLPMLGTLMRWLKRRAAT